MTVVVGGLVRPFLSLSCQGRRGETGGGKQTDRENVTVVVGGVWGGGGTGPPLPASVLSGRKGGGGRDGADRQRECDSCGEGTGPPFPVFRLVRERGEGADRQTECDSCGVGNRSAPSCLSFSSETEREGGQTDRQTEREREREADRQTDRQTNRRGKGEGGRWTECDSWGVGN